VDWISPLVVVVDDLHDRPARALDATDEFGEGLLRLLTLGGAV
jgi:hypothetical protein